MTRVVPLHGNLPALDKMAAPSKANEGDFNILLLNLRLKQSNDVWTTLNGSVGGWICSWDSDTTVVYYEV